MVLEFLQRKKETAKAEKGVKSPVLTSEDEQFLERLVGEAQLPPSEVVLFEGNKSTNAQERLMDGADKVPLPTSPDANTATAANPLDEAAKSPADVKDAKDPKKDKSRRQSYLSMIQKRVPFVPFGKDSSRKQAGTDLQTVANAVKSGDSLAPGVTPEQAEQEKQDMNNLLDQLNLSAVNNRAFSFSKESQRLFDEFTQILKDIINGVPTAYDDLEKFLTRSDKQVKDMYGNLPPFLQNLVKTLPAKFTGTIAPGLLAAAAEKPGFDAQNASASSSSKPRFSKRNIPALKNLVKTDTIAAILKSILNFLKLRFPALISGTNVLLSLAVFILLFVLWYCHKRGKETRLGKEKVPGEESDVSASDMEESLVVEDVSERNPEVERLEAALNQQTPSQSQVPLPAPKEEHK
ncbi:hypothetical protein BT63DRAFT_416962 [Microthyrium microscopicum]|uniref:Uncharacterized protein n=1 Tax=Microthyrium microscopicum TaxID=703497 RepID=A0A6A6U2N8_9PEZI|nr:hypothetical protein BT63DRAFT_416962 [Microthyrium microscopicum]